MHNKEGYYGGPSAAGGAGKGETGGSGGSGEHVTGPSKSGSAHAGGEEHRDDAIAREAAPSYVGSVTGDFREEGYLKPKGRNIQEGGFDSDDAQNASFSGEIGTENDPGRIAEQRFQRVNADAAHDAGSGPRQKGIESGGVGYGNLDSDEQA